MDQVDTSLLAASWRRTWTGLGAAGDGLAAFEDLLARHSEPWRRYHTLQHLHECIACFEPAAALAAHPAEVEAGLWFHDAVYEPRGTGNEERSALLAVQVLSAAGVADAACRRVAELVRVTRHTEAPRTPDEQLLLDIDLGILGAEAPRFAQYERQVREEYSFVPEADFHARRRAILQSFAARQSIYGTQHFRDRFERQARVNLAGSLGLPSP